MPDDRDLARKLHMLTARLDRAADMYLRREAGLSYARFLALHMVGSHGADTQRVLAERLGISEPSVSRMTRVLTEAGLLKAVAAPGNGNRHRLALTTAGATIVTRWGGELERRFTVIVERGGVDYAAYRLQTLCLLAQLDEG